MPIDITKAVGRSQPPPDAWIDAAYQVLVDVLPDEDPALYALFSERFAIAGQAAEALTIREVLEQAGTRLPPEANPLSREAIDKFTIEWSERVAHQAVAQVTDATRQGIAQTIAEGLWREAGVKGGAKGVRIDLLADQVTKDLGRNRGLTAQRIASVEKERARLIAEGVSGDKLEGALDRFAKKQLNDRSKVIAQDQMRQTTSSAQEAQAERYGANEKRWSGPLDDRTRDNCRANIGQGWIPREQAFSSGHTVTPEGPRCRHHIDYRGVTLENVRAVLDEL